jgi:hypothetical protein
MNDESFFDWAETATEMDSNETINMDGMTRAICFFMVFILVMN